MKKFLMLVSMLAVVGSCSAWAGELHGTDAADMAGILNSAGLRSIWDVTIGFVSAQDANCSGVNFADSCEVTPADALPAAKPVPVKAADAQKFWSLLKKAGVENQPGKDHDAGKVVVSASRIDCSLNVDEAQDVCSVQ